MSTQDQDLSGDSSALIPRKVLFGNPDRVSPQLSPDGQKISFLAPVDGVLNVWVGQSDDPDSAQPVTQDTARGIRFHAWAYNNNHIAYVQDKGGDENWHLYGVNLTNGEVTDLTPIEGVQARIQESSRKFPDELLVGLNDRNPQFHDIYRMNIRTGEKRLVQQNDGFAGFVTDDDYSIRFVSPPLPPSRWRSWRRIGLRVRQSLARLSRTRHSRFRRLRQQR